MKDILSRKRRLEEGTVELTEQCSAIIQNRIPAKLKDPGSFVLPCEIGEVIHSKALVDLGSSINLMPYSFCRKLGIIGLTETRMFLQLADRSIKKPKGIVEDLLVKVGAFIFPAYFVILDMDGEVDIPIIFGRPFLNTT